MTTIAYKNGVIAYDSRTTAGSIITNDNADKRIERNGDNFFMCGKLADYEAFFAAMDGVKQDSVPEVSCLAVIGGKVYVCSCDESSGFWKSPIDMNFSYAIGSGSEFAWGAMDCGATAEQAVRVAMKRDSGSGGTVRTFEINQNA